jgi:hypothetical protein
MHGFKLVLSRGLAHGRHIDGLPTRHAEGSRGLGQGPNQAKLTICRARAQREALKGQGLQGISHQ